MRQSKADPPIPLNFARIALLSTRRSERSGTGYFWLGRGEKVFETVHGMSDTLQSSHGEDERSWQGDFDPFSDPEERRVLFAAFDSFR